jgi:hypothetical protein|tara:strand:- start:381 stop:557 length:177 start_codon:yes stop_codon:yes gene_type:complete
VSNASLVAVVDRLQNLLEDGRSDLLREEFLFDDSVKKLASLADLSNKIHILIVFEELI